MPADLRLVAHAAERHAHELAARGIGDRHAERGLAEVPGKPGPDLVPERLLLGGQREIHTPSCNGEVGGRSGLTERPFIAMIRAPLRQCQG